MRRIFRISLSCLMLCCLGTLGCSSAPERPATDPDRSPNPVAALADSAPVVTPVEPAPSSDVLLEDPDPGLTAVLADRPDLAELDGAIADGRLTDAKTLIGLLRARDRLR